MKQRRLPLGGYRRWYAPEISLVKRLAAEGSTFPEIAKAVGRTVRSVQGMCARQRIRVRRPDDGKRWTAEQEQILREEADLMLRRVVGRIGGSHPLSATVDRCVRATMRAGSEMRRLEREAAA